MWFHPRRELPPMSVAPLSTLPRAVDDIQSAQAAQQDTRRRFLEVVEEGVEIRQVASEAKVRRIRNGYEDMIEDAMRLRPGKP